MDSQMHRRDRTIYINNIAKSTTEDDLFTLFQRAGPIEKVIFKNADGTPQHALIVFRRIESVMFCLDNVDYFHLKRQPLGIRPLRESRLTSKPKIPHSAGFEKAQQQFFRFDTDSIQHMRNSVESDRSSNPPTPTWAPEPAGSPLFLQPSPLTLPRQTPRVQLQSRPVNKPPPLQLPTTQNIRQIWVPADQRETYTEPFTAPPFLSASPRFNFPGNQNGNRVMDQFRDWAPPSSPTLSSSSNGFGNDAEIYNSRQSNHFGNSPFF